ncbi:baseplate J/gp47 family protein [Clostridium paraputrificum]|uniref:baseplate J/gp47 family protein n=1 Tax=Clostridium paraputrificum TaxID=29363 RepID=UPI003D325173
MIGEELEKYTFESLINEALEKVPDNVDKREGSIIYDALAPACYQLADMYMRLKNVILNTFVTTSYDKYLDNRVLEQGLKRYEGTKAVKKGIFTFEDNTPAILQIGSRFAAITGEDNLIYKVIGEYLTKDGSPVKGEYLLECETYGTKGNGYIGDLLPITYINNLKTANITMLITPARDRESDEELKDRYILTVNQKPFGGNVAQYDQEVRGIDGIGEVQIYPTWNGGGTVKCSIVDTEYNPVTSEIINKVQTLIDPTVNPGKGLGLAPIGHKVTIVTPTPVTVNIQAKIQVLNGYTIEQLREEITEAISKYLLTLRKNWGIADDMNRYALTIYRSQITGKILGVTGIANVIEIKINNKLEDLTLLENGTVQELPMLGQVVLS